MGVDTQQLRGFDELAAKLRAIAPALRKQALRNALAAGARLVRDEARRRAPVLANTVKAPHRTPGLVRSQIAVRTSKQARRAGDVGVFVNVRPAKGAAYRTTTRRIVGLKIKSRTLVRASNRGANNPRDPFYWRFLEFGTRYMSARPFLAPAAERLPDALGVIRQQLAKWFARAEATGKVVP
jgi:HK97 gp10 family phage protein